MAFDDGADDREAETAAAGRLIAGGIDAIEAVEHVRHVLGRPSEVSYHGTGEAWSWRFNLGGGQLGHLVASFNPDGTLKERSVIMDAASGSRDNAGK